MLTAASTVAVRRGTTGAFTDLAVEASGLGAWNTSDTKRSRPIPSLPATLVIQLLDISDGSVGFTLDDNSITSPLFFLRSGATFAVRIRPEGDGAGKRSIEYVGPATISVLNTEGGGRQYRFQLDATSITRSVQA